MAVYSFNHNMNTVEVRGMELGLMGTVGLELSYPNFGIIYQE